jgi:pimeloyl-ACP methyl ester carboxylesterase
VQHKHCYLASLSGSLAYSEFGSRQKPVLLFVHGVAENQNIWLPAIQLLQNDFCCIAIDLPGHGESAELRGNWSMSFYAQVLRAFIDTMQLKSVTLVAHSMGAQISCIVALQMSSYISNLMLIAPAGIEVFTTYEATALRNWTENSWKQPAANDWLTEQQKNNFPYLTNLGSFSSKLANYNSPETSSELREVIIKSVSGMLAEPVRNFLTQLRQPVTVLIGANDTFVPNRMLHPKLTPQSILDDAGKLFADVRTLLVQHAGHFLPVERPEIIAEQIRKHKIS